MDTAPPIFKRTMELETPDLKADGLDELLAHPDLVILEDNGPGGHFHGAPILLVVERHLIGKPPSAPAVSLTMDELIELRNNLNEAIVHAERASDGV